MFTIAVISQKGGSGKTTTLVNLAVAAQEAGKSVLVVDLDPQASATYWHRERSGSGLHVQPTHPAGLATLMETARTQGVDWALIDTAAQTDTTAAEAAEVADLVLVTCRPSVVDLRAIANTIRLCKIREATPTVVLTHVEQQSTLPSEARTTLEAMGVEVLTSTLGRRVAFHHCMIDGRGVVEYEPKGKAAAEVRSLLRELEKLAKPSPDTLARHHVIGLSRKQGETIHA